MESVADRVKYWADLLKPILTDTQEVIDLAGVPALLDYAGTEGAEPHSYACMPSATELEGPAADKDRVIEFLCALAEHQARPPALPGNLNEALQSYEQARADSYNAPTSIEHHEAEGRRNRAADVIVAHVREAEKTMKVELVAALNDDSAFAALVLETLLPHLDAKFTASTERITDWHCDSARRTVTVDAAFGIRPQVQVIGEGQGAV